MKKIIGITLTGLFVIGMVISVIINYEPGVEMSHIFLDFFLEMIKIFRRHFS